MSGRRNRSNPQVTNKMICGTVCAVPSQQSWIIVRGQRHRSFYLRVKRCGEVARFGTGRMQVRILSRRPFYALWTLWDGYLPVEQVVAVSNTVQGAKICWGWLSRLVSGIITHMTEERLNSVHWHQFKSEGIRCY